MKLSDFNTLQEAQEYTEIKGRLLSSDVLRIFLLTEGLYDTFMEATSGLMRGAADNMRAGGEFNFMTGHPLDQSSLLDALIQQNPAISAALGNLKVSCVNYANQLVTPFEATTEHEFAVVKDTVNEKQVFNQGGYVIIDVYSTCPLHNPRLVGERINTRTGKVEKQRINSFYGVSEVGKYDCIIPKEWQGATLYVDNIYNVIV